MSFYGYFSRLKKKTPYKPSTKSYTVHDIPLSERPRERLKKLGAHALSIHELLAIILGSGTQGQSVIVTANELLLHFKNLKSLSGATLEDLKRIKGLGNARASQIQACFELARRVKQHEEEDIKLENENLKTPSITSPDEIAKLIRSHIAEYKKEHFILVSFDTRNRVIEVDKVSVGTLTASLVHPREVFKDAIRRHAASIIVAHNHPSGDTEPSEEDIKITKRLSEAGRIMGIELLDHIIITNNHYYSFKEKGMM